MRIALAALPAVMAALLLAPASLFAAESTRIIGAVRGAELCPQFVCGAAVFIGQFDGALDGTPGKGTWWVVVNHEDLPEPAESAPIIGGRWGMTVGERGLGGAIASGTIVNNGDGTFTVTPRLDVISGGEGTLMLSILLDHTPFPPTVTGGVGTSALPFPDPTRTGPALTPPATPDASS